MRIEPLVILGAGGHGRELLDIVEAINAKDSRYKFLGFLDDTGGNLDILASRSATVIGPIKDLEHIDAVYAIGMGAPEARRQFDQVATSWGHQAAILIHPEATLGSDLTISPGCVIAAGARVTTHTTLGRHTHLNINCTVSHDCSLGDYVTLSPGSHVSGWTVLEHGVTLGTGAVTKDRITIGEGSVVGAGAVVVDDIPAFVIAKGVPARSEPTTGKTHSRWTPG